MPDQIPFYEQEVSEKFKEVLETGIVPENITEEDAKLLYEALRNEAEILISTVKSTEDTLNNLLQSINGTVNTTNVQLDALMKALEIIEPKSNNPPEE